MAFAAQRRETREATQNGKPGVAHCAAKVGWLHQRGLVHGKPGWRLGASSCGVFAYMQNVVWGTPEGRKGLGLQHGRKSEIADSSRTIENGLSRTVCGVWFPGVGMTTLYTAVPLGLPKVRVDDILFVGASWFTDTSFR